MTLLALCPLKLPLHLIWMILGIAKVSIWNCWMHLMCRTLNLCMAQLHMSPMIGTRCTYTSQKQISSSMGRRQKSTQRCLSLQTMIMKLIHLSTALPIARTPAVCHLFSIVVKMLFLWAGYEITLKAVLQWNKIFCVFCIGPPWPKTGYQVGKSCEHVVCKPWWEIANHKHGGMGLCSAVASFAVSFACMTTHCHNPLFLGLSPQQATRMGNPQVLPQQRTTNVQTWAAHVRAGHCWVGTIIRCWNHQCWGRLCNGAMPWGEGAPLHRSTWRNRAVLSRYLHCCCLHAYVHVFTMSCFLGCLINMPLVWETHKSFNCAEQQMCWCEQGMWELVFIDQRAWPDDETIKVEAECVMVLCNEGEVWPHQGQGGRWKYLLHNFGVQSGKEQFCWSENFGGNKLNIATILKWTTLA